MASLQTNYERGHKAEDRMAWYLRCKGYRIIDKRFKTPVGEIDIIAKKGGALIFVEVKYRQNTVALGEAISVKNRRRVEKAAQLFCQKHRLSNQQWRFDAILLAPKKWPHHIKQAWIFGE